MLSHIEISNFAIIEQLSLDFHQGFHIITGETGAGKSILIEAVSLALGSRADTSFVRTGSDKAVINLIAEGDDPQVTTLLSENGIDGGFPLLLTREVYASGKSLARINGTLVPISVLNKISRHLADIHGQYDHQSLLDPENHIRLIDRYQGDAISPAKAEVSEQYRKYTAVTAQLNDLLRHGAERARQKDFMAFELQEIETAAPKIGEDEELEQEQKLLQNGERISEHLARAYEALTGEGGAAMDLLGNVYRNLQELEDYSSELSELSKETSDCFYRLEDVSSGIRRAKENLSFSPEDLDRVTERLDILEKLKKKYGGTLEKVLNYRDHLISELEKTENSDALQATLQAELTEQKKTLLKASLHLSKLRKTAAAELEQRVSAELRELHFKDAKLSAAFEPLPEEKDPPFSEEGIDHLEFLISANKGEDLKPLAKIASGGEISRIMLAFKAIIGSCDRIPTQIFDEIDTGISGIAASVVGRKLAAIAEDRQVICITHLPQIAACGDHHYRIEKQETGDRTCTTVVPLKEEEKVPEIARLLGGMNITETTLKSAEELLTFSRSRS